MVIFLQLLIIFVFCVINIFIFDKVQDKLPTVLPENIKLIIIFGITLLNSSLAAVLVILINQG